MSCDEIFIFHLPRTKGERNLFFYDGVPRVHAVGGGAELPATFTTTAVH